MTCVTSVEISVMAFSYSAVFSFYFDLGAMFSDFSSGDNLKWEEAEESMEISLAGEDASTFENYRFSDSQ